MAAAMNFTFTSRAWAGLMAGHATSDRVSAVVAACGIATALQTIVKPRTNFNAQGWILVIRLTANSHGQTR